MKAVLIAATAVALTGVAATTDAQQVINNGGFEAGLAGWTVETWPFSNGSLEAFAGLVGPHSGQAVAGPFEGSLYALTDQGGPGAYALSQVFRVTAVPTSAVLTFAMFLNNWAAETVIGPDFDPLGEHLNQWASVDLFFGAVSGFTTAAPLQNFFQGSMLAAGGSNPWVVYSFDIAPLLTAPGDYTLRFAETDNLFFHNMGVDNVSLVLGTTTVPEPISMLLLGTGLAAIGATRRRRRHS